MRRAWRLRSTRRDVAETAYAVYVAGVMALFVVAPGVAVVIEALRNSAVLDALRSPAAPTAVTLPVGLTWAGATWVGAGSGPVTIDQERYGRPRGRGAQRDRASTRPNSSHA